MQEDANTIRPKIIWNMLWPVAKPYAKFLPLFVILYVVLALAAVAEPYLYGSIIDVLVSALEHESVAAEVFQGVMIILFLWGGLVIFETTLTALSRYFAWQWNNFILGKFLEQWYARVVHLDVELFRSERSGEILRKFDNAWDGFWNVIDFSLRSMLEATTRFGAAFVVGMMLDWRLTLVALIPVPVSIFVGLWQLRISTRHQHKVNRFWERMSGHIGDSFTNIATVKSFCKEKSFIRIMGRMYTKSLRYQARVNKNWSAVDAGYGAIYITGRLLIFSAGVWFVVNGTTTLGTLIMFLGFANFLFGSVQQIMIQLPQMTRSLVDLDRAAVYWNKVPLIQEKKEAKVLRRVKGDIAFERVSFAYDKEQVLKNVDFSIPEGKVYALVGKSGAGKSTLAQMLLRYYDPQNGRVTIDGYDIRDLTLKSVRSHVGFVMQENLLFHDSILNNIRLANPRASRKEIEQAAKRAQAHAFIQAFPKGYDSVVGERGVKLSGGEKQRIALARIFLEDPRILVLDEATSALDSKTEHDLQIALREAMKGRTTLIIAHRLSTVMDADQILVMDKGRIVAQGSHAELVKTNALYREYWTIQAGGYM